MELSRKIEQLCIIRVRAHWKLKVNKYEIIPREIYSCILTDNEHKEFITAIIIFGYFAPLSQKLSF